MAFESLFIESKGQPIVYQDKVLQMLDRITLATTTTVRMMFVATDSQWTQGFVLQTKGEFEVNGQTIPNKVIFWEDTAPNEFEITVNSKDNVLLVYNVWRAHDGTVHYWHNGGAMYVEFVDDYRVYHCNDGDPDDDLNDLIFKLSYK